MFIMGLTVIPGITLLASKSFLLSVITFVASMFVARNLSSRADKLEQPEKEWESKRGSFGETSEKVVYQGIPGMVATSNNNFDRDKVEAGAEGERRTAAILNLIEDKAPGMRVYHGLRFPGTKNADIDHAIAYGDSLMLIDSKMFRPGSYSIKSDVVKNSGQQLEKIKSLFPDEEALKREHGETWETYGILRIIQDRVLITRYDERYDQYMPAGTNHMPSAAFNILESHPYIHHIHIVVVVHSDGPVTASDYTIECDSEHGGATVSIVTADNLLCGPIANIINWNSHSAGYTKPNRSNVLREMTVASHRIINDDSWKKYYD